MQFFIHHDSCCWIASKSEETVDSDDEPLSKKIKAAPTDDDLRAAVKKILEGANLDDMTVKKV